MTDFSFAARFGSEAARSGVDVFPHVLLKEASILSLSRTERLVLIGLLSAWRGAPVEVSCRRLAEKSGLSRSAAAAALRRLEGRGLIRVERRRTPEAGDAASRYDLGPLLSRLEELAGTGPENLRAQGAFAARFGPTLAGDGTAALPGGLLRAAWLRELSVGARLAVAVLLAARWTDENPRLTVGTLAGRMGTTRRHARRLLGELEAAGLVRRDGTGGFDLSGLLIRVSAGAPDRQTSDLGTGGVRSADTGRTSADTGGTSADTGGGTSADTGGTSADTGGTSADTGGRTSTDTGRTSVDTGRTSADTGWDICGHGGRTSADTNTEAYVQKRVQNKEQKILQKQINTEDLRYTAAGRPQNAGRPDPSSQGIENHSEVWEKVKAAVKGELSANNYRIWIEPLRPVGLVGNQLILSGPEYVVGWVRTRLSSVLNRAARKAGLDGVGFGAGAPAVPNGRPQAVIEPLRPAALANNRTPDRINHGAGASGKPDRTAGRAGGLR